MTKPINTGKKIYDFFTNLHISPILPNGITTLNPYQYPEVLRINNLFYKKYYNDTKPRILLLGINPGRLGAGITGISFTDPIELAGSLNIKNSFVKKQELSANFIHKFIRAYGGAKLFFKDFLLTSVSPLGFVKEGVNVNYYDDKTLFAQLKGFIESTLTEQFDITNKLPVCGCIGHGKNLEFLKSINKELQLFKEIIPLPHPRWIMQYQRKELDKQIAGYVATIKSIKEKVK